jgi:serine/threonine-protein kinase
MGQQVADALAAAHAAGLVHRDIKPSNILLSPDGRVQVADFGIVQAAAATPVTATGITLGSVLYFSPEQARGDAATAASDVYSLGLVMYEMLTGQRAFSGDSPAAVAVARLSGRTPSPMAVRAETPPALDAIVRWCLSVDPNARPSAAELSSALARFRTDPSGAAALAAAGIAAAVPMGTPGVPPPPTQSTHDAHGTAPPYESERGGTGPWTWLAAGLGLIVIIASGILLFLLFSGVGDEQPAASPTPVPTVALVSTPDFVGMREGRAQVVAVRSDVVLEVAYRETASVEAGLVIEQLPEPGTEVEAGTSVQVTVATQVETVVVPDVHGINEANTVKALETAGLHAGERWTAYDRLPPGYVVSTDPRAGSSVTRGTDIAYTVSLGPGLGSSGAPRITSRPQETQAAERTPEPTPFPSSAATRVYDYSCQPLETARAHIAEVGLVVGAVIPEDHGADWIVLDQLPRPGASIEVGSKVDLMLGDPNEPCPPG